MGQERKISRLSDQLDAHETYLRKEQQSVDVYSQASVDAFNAKVKRYNDRVANLEAKANAFNASCADRAYFEDDMQAVKATLDRE